MTKEIIRSQCLKLSEYFLRNEIPTDDAQDIMATTMISVLLVKHGAKDSVLHLSELMKKMVANFEEQQSLYSSFQHKYGLTDNDDSENMLTKIVTKKLKELKDKIDDV